MKKWLLGFGCLLILTGCNSDLVQVPSLPKIDVSIPSRSAEPTPPPPETTELADGLAFVSPSLGSDDITGKVPLNFLWNESIFPLQNHQQAKKLIKKHVLLTPAHNGEWQILGTTGLSFVPKEDWPLSTRFQVAVSEDLVPGGLTYTFETPRLNFESVSESGLVDQNPLVIRLNQAVDLKLIRPALRLWQGEDQGNSLDFDLTYGTKTIENTEQIDRSVLVLTPRINWVEAAYYSVQLAPGNFTTTGNVPLPEALTVTFQADAPFHVQSWNMPTYHNEAVQFDFSANIDRAIFLDFLEILPAPDPAVWADYRQTWQKNLDQSLARTIWLSPPGKAWIPGQETMIRFKPGLTDEYGRVLNPEFEQKFIPKLQDQFQSIFVPQPDSVFPTGVKIPISYRYAGKDKTITVTLNNEQKKYSLKASDLKFNTWTIDLAKEFPQWVHPVTGAGFVPGQYELRIDNNTMDEYQQNQLAVNFYVSDFAIELKQLADQRYQFSAQAFPGEEALPPVDDIEIWIGDWQTSERYQPTADILEGGAFGIPENKFLKTVMVRAGNLVGYGSTQFNRGIEPWNARVNHGDWQYQQILAGTLFTDRPLYKPGDTLHYQGLIRERELFGRNFLLKDVIDDQKKYSYELTIHDPTYEQIFSTKGEFIGQSLADEIVLPDTGMLGQYQVNLTVREFEPTADSDQNRDLNLYTSFWIEEYRKPNFLLFTKFDQERAFPEETINLELTAQYAFGAPVENRPLTYTVTLFGTEPCQFWCWDWQSKKDKVLFTGEGVLDDQGQFRLPVNLKNLERDDIDWNLLTVNATVQVSESETSSIEQSIPFARADRQFDLQRVPYFFVPDTETTLRGTVLDFAGERVAKTEVEIELVKTIWVRNERKNADGRFYGEWESVAESVQTETVKTDRRGGFAYDFTPPTEGGQYALIFRTDDAQKRVAEYQHGFWIAGSDMTRVKENDTNKILWLFPDQDGYEVGERVEIFAPNPEFKITRAHATIERGEVLETLDVNLDTSTLSFVAEDWMAPNIFVTVLFEGVDATGSPRITWGTQNIQIHDPAHNLDVSVTPQQSVYRPGEDVTLTIQTHVQGVGVPAEVTVAVVDQTLLALKARQPIDLIRDLIGDLNLGVTTFHTLANFVSAQDLAAIEAQIDSLVARMELGFGGGGGKGDDFKPRGDFRDTAVFKAKVLTDEMGQAMVTFPVPDNLTTWNVLAVGATNQNAFGTAETDFQVSLPLLISEVVPNFFQSGDTIELGLVIHRDDSELSSESVTVMLKVPETLSPVGATTKTITVTDQAEIFFPVTVNQVTNEQTIQFGFVIKAEASDLQDSIVLERKVVPPFQTLTAADLLRIAGDQALTLKPDPAAITSEMKIKVFASLAQYLDTLIDITQKVDYGCTEQRFSRSTAQLYQADLDASLGRSTAALDRDLLADNRDFVHKSFKNNAGFGFWKSSAEPNFWVTAHVLEHAPLWKKFDVPLDPTLLDTAADWLRQETLKVCDEGSSWRCYHDSTRLQAAYVLTQYDRLSVHDLAFLDRYTSTLEAKVWWLKTAEQLGALSPDLQTRYDQHWQTVMESLVIRDRYAFWSDSEQSFYAQDERLTAIVLEMLLAEKGRGKKEEGGFGFEDYHKVAAYLAETDKKFLSGNSAMWVLKALAQYVRAAETKSLGAVFSVQDTTTDQTLLKGSLETFEQRQSFTGELTEDQHELVVIADKPVLTEVQLQDTLPAEKISANSRGFWLERSVVPVSAGRDLIDHVSDQTKSLTLGQNYVVTLKVVTSQPHRQVLVEDPIPSGTELVNFSLDNADQTLSAAIDNTGECRWGWCQPLYEHQEFRYDRARFFIDYLPAGTYEIQYVLKARLPGEFDWLSARIEEMYAPEVFANTEGQRIEIERK